MHFLPMLFTEATSPSPVLIAVASWGSASVAAFSFPAPPTTNINAAHKPEDQIGARKRPDSSSTAVAENIASWLPPWGGVIKASMAPGAPGGGGTTSLTRSLAFVRFGTGSEGLSLVAATGDGAVAVAQWQGERGKGEWRTGHKKTGGKGFSRGTLVTTASVQVGRGPVRLEVFQSAGLTVERESRVERDDGDGEKLFVNGDMMDAVIRRFSDTAEETLASDQCRDRWQCTQVGRFASHSYIKSPGNVLV